MTKEPVDGEHMTLAQSEEQFRLLVQSVTDYAIFMLDVNGVVSNWNAGAHRIKGYSAAEIVGKHFSIFYSNEDQQAGLPGRGLKTAAEEGRFEHEGWRHRKDGSRFWANVVIDRIVDDQGKLIGFAKVTRDMTERRDAHLALDKGPGRHGPVTKDGCDWPADRRGRARFQQPVDGGAGQPGVA